MTIFFKAMVLPVLLLTGLYAVGQCGTDWYQQQLLRSDPSLSNRRAAFDLAVKNLVNKHQGQTLRAEKYSRGISCFS
jgi:hypothetical protein